MARISYHQYLSVHTKKIAKKKIECSENSREKISKILKGIISLLSREYLLCA